MAFFKTDEDRIREKEEKLRKEEEKLRKEEDFILKNKKYYGKIGHIPQGITTFAGLAVAADNKTKYKSSYFNLYDDKLFIERNKVVVNFSDIKEVFYENKLYPDAVIVLYSGDGIPIKGKNNKKDEKIKLKAFVNVLNRLIKNYKPDSNQTNNPVNSDDKMNRLIKLGDMYEKGLISDEEFATMKQNLINSKNENTCKNCGAELSKDSNFCSECGTKIE